MALTVVPPAVAAWHKLVAEPQVARLRDLLAPEVVFRSPAVHTPKEGRDDAAVFLWAALSVLGPTLKYGCEWIDENSAVLQFSATVDGLDVSGVDIVRWNADDQFTEFTVMIRPLKGLQGISAAIGAELGRQQ